MSHSDAERFYSYESLEALGTLRSYKQTLRVAPIVDTNTAFVEWSAEFNAPADEQDPWKKCFTDEAAKSWEKLRTYLAEQ